MAWYWGLPSPALAEHVGQPVNRSTTRRVDEYGYSIFGGQALPGDAWRNRHDHVKWALFEMIKALDVDIKCEVLHMFTQHVSQEGRTQFQGGRQGVIPDYKIVFGNSAFLADMKTIGLGKSLYHNAQTQSTPPGYAVEARARQVPAEYRRKARAADRQYNGTAAGEVGPLETAMAAFGDVVPLVVGHFGEVNDALDRLLRQVAEVGAARLQDALYAKTPEQATAVLLWQLRRKLVSASLRASLNCLHELMGHVSGGAAAASKRRAAARNRFFPRGDASHTSYHYRASFSTFGGGWW